MGVSTASRTLFLASFVATQHDLNAKAYYQHKRAEGKKHNAAVICVARRRCDLILAILKTGTPYDADRHENPPRLLLDNKTGTPPTVTGSPNGCPPFAISETSVSGLLSRILF